jgi:hypothetical protein
MHACLTRSAAFRNDGGRRRPARCGGPGERSDILGVIQWR